MESGFMWEWMLFEMGGLIVMMIIGSIIMGIGRSIVSGAKKIDVLKNLDSIKNDPAKAAGYSASLDVPYKTRQYFSPESFNVLKVFLGGVESVGDFHLMHLNIFDEHNILIFTKHIVQEIDIVDEKEVYVDKVEYHTFVIRYNPSSRELSLWSNLYDGATEKMRKESFLNALLKENARIKRTYRQKTRAEFLAGVRNENARF